MKKRKEFVVFQFKEGDSVYEVKMYTEDLREIVKSAEKEQKQVRFEINDGKGTNFFNVEISELKKILKKSELSTEIVPRSLSQYLVDITRSFSLSEPKMPIKGRDEEIKKTWFYLSQKERNNVYLVGDIDVGKTAIALEIARQISESECPKEFYDTRVVMLKPEEILNIRFDFKFNRILASIENFLEEHKNNVILYIDKGITMKTDIGLIVLLQSLIVKHHIPILSTIDEKNFEEYFLNDSSISKYLNYVYVEKPELEEIEPMIKAHLEDLKKTYNISISKEMVKFGIFTSVLSNSVSSDPGNVINVFRRAFLEAKRNEKEDVDKQCILSCYPSYWKLYKSMTLEDKKSIACHEAGHYVVTILCDNVKDEKIRFVSILPMMDFLGVNWRYKVFGQTQNHTKNYFLDHIAISMAGRIAEKLEGFEESTGAVSDLINASEIAEEMILVYGLSEMYEFENRTYITSEYNLKKYLLYEEKTKKIDEEIQKLINEGVQIATEILRKNFKLLQIISHELLEKEILTGEELSKIVEKYKKEESQLKA